MAVGRRRPAATVHRQHTPPMMRQLAAKKVRDAVRYPPELANPAATPPAAPPTANARLSSPNPIEWLPPARSTARERIHVEQIRIAETVLFASTRRTAIPAMVSAK